MERVVKPRPLAQARCLRNQRPVAAQQQRRRTIRTLIEIKDFRHFWRSAPAPTQFQEVQVTRYAKALLALSIMGAGSAAQAEQGDVLVRARAIMVAPNESSNGVNPAFPTDRLKVSDTVTPEVDVTYMITDNIGAELIAATTRHSISGVGATAPLGKLAETSVLPPTLTLQYHLAPQASVRPYVGAGINYTIFYNEDATSALQGAVGTTRVGLSDSVGWAAQAGIDFDIGRNLFLNLDVKYIDIRTTATLTTAGAGVQTSRVRLSPFVFGAGFGTRF